MDGIESGLMIPVPEAEPIVGTHRFALDQSARWGVPAHVTVLYPFMPPADISETTLIALAELFAQVDAFGFALVGVGWFGHDVVYATPIPDRPFRELTAAVANRWPAFPPYGGEHGEPTPHLTIGDDGSPSDLEKAGDEVERHLPLTCMAREVWLMTGSASAGWSRQAVFPLGADLGR